MQLVVPYNLANGDSLQHLSIHFDCEACIAFDLFISKLTYHTYFRSIIKIRTIMNN